MLPIPIHTVSYEELVSDPETVTRDLLSFCNLELSPTEDKKVSDAVSELAPVRTASYWQVRQPIYQTSVEKWRQYEAHIQPLIEALSKPTLNGNIAPRTQEA